MTSVPVHHYTTAYLRMRVACAQRGLTSAHWGLVERGAELEFASESAFTRWLLEFGA